MTDNAKPQDLSDAEYVRDVARIVAADGLEEVVKRLLAIADKLASDSINLNDKAVQKRLAAQWGYVLPDDAGVEFTRVCMAQIKERKAKIMEAVDAYANARVSAATRAHYDKGEAPAHRARIARLLDGEA